MQHLLALAGIGHLTLAAVSLGIPRELRWREQTQALDPLTRRVFWTYASYILGTNIALGLLCLLVPEQLTSGSRLALAVSGYVLLYWGARLVLQLVSFRNFAPKGLRYRIADASFTAFFAYVTGLFGWIVWTGLGG